LFFTVLEAGKSKAKGPASLEGHVSWSVLRAVISWRKVESNTVQAKEGEVNLLL
jgi:hypothetical protein